MADIIPLRTSRNSVRAFSAVETAVTLYIPAPGIKEYDREFAPFAEEFTIFPFRYSAATEFENVELLASINTEVPL